MHFVFFSYFNSTVKSRLHNLRFLVTKHSHELKLPCVIVSAAYCNSLPAYTSKIVYIFDCWNKMSVGNHLGFL